MGLLWRNAKSDLNCCRDNSSFSLNILGPLMCLWQCFVSHKLFRPVDLKMLELAMGLGRRQLTVLCNR